MTPARLTPWRDRPDGARAELDRWPPTSTGPIVAILRRAVAIAEEAVDGVETALPSDVVARVRSERPSQEAP